MALYSDNLVCSGVMHFKNFYCQKYFICKSVRTYIRLYMYLGRLQKVVNIF